MARWTFLVGGLLIWAAHFLGVYLIASVADVAEGSDAPAWRMAGLGFSLLCLLAVVMFGVFAWRRRDDARMAHWDFARSVALTGSGVALIGVIYQTLPLLVG